MNEIKNGLLQYAVELVQEAHIVLEVEAQVLHTKFEHCDTLNSHTKRKARILLRVYTARFEDIGIDHSATHNLQPSGTLADGTSLATA